MNEEEYIRKRMEMIKRNSVYGLVGTMTNSEIAKIIHDYIEMDTGNGYDRFNSPPPPIPIRPVKIKTLKERLEDNKMNATSTEEFKDIIAIDFELQTFPNPDENDKFIVSATNRDDIFCFVFEGPYIADACRKAGLFTSWEKDQKIRELEKENKQNKEIADTWSTAYYDLSKKFDKLQKEYQSLKDSGCNVVLHGMDFTPEQLVDRIIELEELKTPTIENFTDEEPSSRADILDCAKKCVCGKREQDYGTPESNFQLIADLWNDYLGFTDPGDKIQAKDVAMLMALMKIARIRNGGGSGDSFVDLAGYAACGGEIWAGEKKQ